MKKHFLAGLSALAISVLSFPALSAVLESEALFGYNQGSLDLDDDLAPSSIDYRSLVFEGRFNVIFDPVRDLGMTFGARGDYTKIEDLYLYRFSPFIGGTALVQSSSIFESNAYLRAEVAYENIRGSILSEGFYGSYFGYGLRLGLHGKSLNWGSVRYGFDAETSWSHNASMDSAYYNFKQFEGSFALGLIFLDEIFIGPAIKYVKLDLDGSSAKADGMTYGLALRYGI